MASRDVSASMNRPELKVRDLPGELERAGYAFKDAISRLGLSAEGLLWAYEPNDDKFEMWIVWSGLNTFGPLNIARLLFKAYNAAALPQEIDPFTINVVGPEDLIGRLHGSFFGKSNIPRPEDGEYAQVTTEVDGVKSALVVVKRSWVLQMSNRRLPLKEIKRGWRRFNESVEALAA